MIDTYRPLAVSALRPLRRRGKRRATWRILGAALGILAPFVLLGAYEPGALLGLNNLSDLTSLSAARNNLFGGLTGCVSVSGGAVTASGSCAGSYSTTAYTSNTATLTLGTTNLNIELIAQGTPAALTIDLPVVSGLANGFTTCVKDKSNSFTTNNATVKTTDGATIDGVAGTTGYVMNQTKQANCFVTDATNWYVE